MVLGDRVPNSCRRHSGLKVLISSTPRAEEKPHTEQVDIESSTQSKNFAVTRHSPIEIQDIVFHYNSDPVAFEEIIFLKSHERYLMSLVHTSVEE